MSLYEAAALGANMSVPYGAWLGSVKHDSLWVPHELCVEIQRFLADHERLFSRQTCAETAVVYSVESNFRRVARRDQFADNRNNVSRDERVPFWEVCEALSAAVQPYDVLFFPDGHLRPDMLTSDDLLQFRTVILPGCDYLTEAQVVVLGTHLERGGHIVAIGALGANLPDSTRRVLLDHPNVRLLDEQAALDVGRLPGGPQLRLDRPTNVAINPQRLENGVAVHLIRYDYDADQDRTPALPELTIDLRLPERYTRASIFSPDSRGTVELSFSNDEHRMTLRDVPLYTIALLEP
jgi:hypothetical protein